MEQPSSVQGAHVLEWAQNLEVVRKSIEVEAEQVFAMAVEKKICSSK